MWIWTSPSLRSRRKKILPKSCHQSLLSWSLQPYGKRSWRKLPNQKCLNGFRWLYGSNLGCYVCSWRQKTRTQKKAEEKLKFFFGKFEKKYVDLGKGKHFIGDKFTLADIVVGAALPAAVDALGLKECPCKEVAPNLGELIKRLKENELKEFFEKYYIK